MKLLSELTADLKIFEEVIELEEGRKKKNMYIEGVTLQSEVKNKNGRVYPKAILSAAIKKHVTEFMEADRAVGELNHPEEKSSEITEEKE